MNKLVATFLLIFLTAQTYGQGCSDAGFCTMGSMRPAQHFQSQNNIRLRSMEFSHYVGLTKFKDAITAYTFDANVALGKQISFQVKLPYMVIFAPLSNTKGIGDISYSFSKNLLFREKYQLNATLGGKIPTNKGDKMSADKRPLPMYYQTSLGTYDLVFGISLISRKWLISTGYQMPIKSILENEFVWARWNSSPDSATAALYPRSNQLKRGNDVMLRIERSFRFSKFSLQIALLSIYRLNQDYITLRNVEVKQNTTDGLVVNALFSGAYRFSTRSSFKILFGKGLIQRKMNADGLSRQFVNSIAYEWKF